MPSHYRQEGHGTSYESRLVQQARLNANDKGSLYAAASWKDANGNIHYGIGKADTNGHAESRALDDLQAKIAQHEGVDPSQVSLNRDGVKIYAEYSPCNTKPRFCQQEITDRAPNAEVSYSHPWQPRSARDDSRAGLKKDLEELFRRGTVGPL
jgi:hypothetical protein